MRKAPYIVGFAIIAYSTLFAGIVFAQGVTGVGNLITNDPISTYLDKGGTVMTWGILLYFYRTLMESTKEQSSVLIRIVADSTKSATESALAQGALARAIEANTSATQALSARINSDKPRS